jgi:hypothetical protein
MVPTQVSNCSGVNSNGFPHPLTVSNSGNQSIVFWSPRYSAITIELVMPFCIHTYRAPSQFYRSAPMPTSVPIKPWVASSIRFPLYHLYHRHGSRGFERSFVDFDIHFRIHRSNNWATSLEIMWRKDWSICICFEATSSHSNILLCTVLPHDIHWSLPLHSRRDSSAHRTESIRKHLSNFISRTWENVDLSVLAVLSRISDADQCDVPLPSNMFQRSRFTRLVELPSIV